MEPCFAICEDHTFCCAHTASAWTLEDQIRSALWRWMQFCTSLTTEPSFSVGWNNNSTALMFWTSPEFSESLLWTAGYTAGLYRMMLELLFSFVRSSCCESPCSVSWIKLALQPQTCTWAVPGTACFLRTLGLVCQIVSRRRKASPCPWRQPTLSATRLMW